jgi:Protein of unknown function (DUF2786)
MSTPLSAHHQRFLLQRLALDWRRLNDDHVNGRLREPTFQIDLGTRNLASWTPRTRTISFSAEHLASGTSWKAIEDTLRHEMAHQIVSELFEAGQVPPHGELFRRACQMMGVDGRGGAAAALDPVALRAMERVRKLLALSSSSEVHEAQSAMEQASRLLLKYNLDQVGIGEGQVEVRRLGTPCARVPTESKLVSNVLREHFFVQTIWVSDGPVGEQPGGRVLEVIGRPENVEMAAYVHAFLHRSLDRLWERFRVDGPSDRRSRGAFRVGVVDGLLGHLDQQRRVVAETGLVWVGDPVVAEFYRSRYPRTRRMGGGTYLPGDAHQAGQAEGGRLRIHPGIGAHGGVVGLLGKGD